MALTGTMAKKQIEVGKRLEAIGLVLVELTSNTNDRYKGGGPVRYRLTYHLPFAAATQFDYTIEGADRLDALTSAPKMLAYVLWYTRNRTIDTRKGGDKLREKVDRAKKDYGRAVADHAEKVAVALINDPKGGDLANISASPDADRYGKALVTAAKEREKLYAEIKAIVGPEPELPDFSGGFWTWIPRY